MAVKDTTQRADQLAPTLKQPLAEPGRRSDGTYLPGVSGNPRGRSAAGASYAEWLNVLADENEDGTAKFTAKDLRKIRDDLNAPPTKRAAARDLLGMMKGGYSKAGVPLMSDHRNAVCDRTVGKPAQQIDLRSLNVHVKRIELVDRRAGELPQEQGTTDAENTEEA